MRFSAEVAITKLLLIKRANTTTAIQSRRQVHLVSRLEAQGQTMQKTKSASAIANYQRFQMATPAQPHIARGASQSPGNDTRGGHSIHASSTTRSVSRNPPQFDRYV